MVMGSRAPTGYRISTAARLAGLTPEVLRAWERRYGLTNPARSTGRFRLYTESDVELLRGAKALVDAGQSIGEVARLPARRLREAAAGLRSVRVGALPGDGAGVAKLRMEALAAARVFDRARFARALGAGAATLAPLDFSDELLLPVLRDLGDAWHRGEISAAAEHFASALVRRRLVQISEGMPRWLDMPRLVCACPSGERHEGALLAHTVHAAAAGWEVIYLGADVPDGEILDVASEVGARAVALSLTIEVNEGRLDALIDMVQERRDRGLRSRVVVGGQGATPHRARLVAAGLEHGETVRAVAMP